MRDTLTRQQRRAAQLRGRGWSLTEIAKEIGVSTRTLARWNRLPAFRGERARMRDELDAEQPLSVRQTLEAALLATKGDGSPDWNARSQAARTLASLPAEEVAEPEPQLFCIRVKPTGEQEEIWGILPPGFKSPAAVTMTVEDGAFPPGEADSDGWQ
jgi:hypothetical protein